MSRVAVIGGGLAGLAATVALAVRGHAVTLLESGPAIGGKARHVEQAGARVDLGPTLVSDLSPLDDLFSRAGAELEREVALERLDPGLLATFPGGRRILVAAGAARVASGLEALGADAPADWQRLLALGERARRLTEHFYARGDLAGPREVLGFVLPRRVGAGDLLPFARHGSLARLLEATVRTPELRAFWGHFARFLGLDAESAPAVTLVIPYLLALEGVWYPQGGFSALARRIGALAMKHGADIAVGERVEALESTAGQVRAVVTAGGRRLPVDACVSAVDVAQTARWLGDARLERVVTRLRPALAAHVAWWVIEAPPREAVHHALHFGPDRGTEPLYVATPTVTDPTLAPPGATIVYALVHGRPGATDLRALVEGLRARIVAAGQWPPGPVMAGGVAIADSSCYGYEIGPGLLSAFRPSQRVAGVGNCFLAGGSGFPGPGVANVVRSGLRAADLAEARLAGGRR